MKCRLCGYDFYNRLVFEINGAPKGAQYYPLADEFSGDIGLRLRLCACPVCNLYQLDNAPVPYYKDVIRSGGYTKTMLELRKKQYAKMFYDFELKDKRLFECGCGRGEFLKVWDEFSVEAVGIEHSESLVHEAQIQNLKVEQGFIGSATDKLSSGLFDAFTSFNFLEHQPDPNGMLQGIYNNLTDSGVGLITVPSWEYINEMSAYYELVVDHLSYFSRDTFSKILTRNGFSIEVFDESLEDTHAAYVRKEIISLETGLGEKEGELSASLLAFARNVKHDNGQLVVWGASHQAFTILACAGISCYVDYIVDSAEFKQSKYSPGSHLPICSPNRLLTDSISGLIVIAPNYTDEIVEIVRIKMNLSCPLISVRDGGAQRHI